jgi:tetratricopeptide (TPR) repeat protein
VAAYEQYLQGRYHANLSPMDTDSRPGEYFRRATELDPAYALAFVGLARAHIGQAIYTVIPSELSENFALAGKALDRALELEPNLPEALGAKAEMLLWSKYDWRGADQAVRQALTLAPNEPTLLGTASLLCMLTGQLDKGAALGRQATTLDPLNGEALLNLSSIYAIQRRFPEAEVLRRRVLEVNPKAMQAYSAQADDYLMQGRFDEAVETVMKEPAGWTRDVYLAMALWGQGKISESEAVLQRLKDLGDIAGGLVASVYAYRQDADQAFAWLERGLQARDVGVIGSKTNPHLLSLQADPRWPVWLRKLGLHDDQLSEFIPDYKETKFTPPAAVSPKGAAPVILLPTSLRPP